MKKQKKLQNSTIQKLLKIRGWGRKETKKIFMKDIKKHKENILAVVRGGINRFILGISTGDKEKNLLTGNLVAIRFPKFAEFLDYQKIYKP